jgi:hypothetical protein
MKRMIPAKIVEIERRFVAAFNLATGNLENGAWLGPRAATVDNDQRCASARSKHDSHAVGTRIEQTDVGARSHGIGCVQQTNDFQSNGVVGSVRISASDYSDHEGLQPPGNVPTLDPPQAAGPVRLDRKINLGQFTVPAMNLEIHAGLTRLIDTVVFNGRLVEPGYGHLGNHIVCCGLQPTISCTAC